MNKTESYYNEKAKSYDKAFEILYFKIFDVITWKYIEPYVPTDPNALVLDAGGGTGRWSIQIASKGCKVILMDISEEMLKIAAKKVEKESLWQRIAIRKGDITRTEYADETFDMILCEHALFLFKDPDIILKEFRRIAKKKAPLIISAHNRYVQSLASLSEKPSVDNIENALNILTSKKHDAMDKEEKLKIYTWTPEEFREMLERNGFFIEKMGGRGHSMPLRISKESFMKKDYSRELFNKILEYELTLCEKPDALALAGHLQAIARKL
jgi:ubiquinone/menaquinone biosynthesis C-methylase UbiE